MSHRNFPAFLAAAFAGNFVWAMLWARFYPESGDFAIWLDRWPGIGVFYTVYFGVPVLIGALIGRAFSVWNRKTALTYKLIGVLVCLFVYFLALVAYGVVDFCFGCTLFGDCGPIGY